MPESDASRDPASRRPIRWWPGLLVLALAAIAIVWVRAQADWPFQRRNLTTLPIVLAAALLLLVWWTFLSRARLKLRLGITFGLLGLLGLGALSFRVRGVSGDLLPILEFRWGREASFEAVTASNPAATN